MDFTRRQFAASAALFASPGRAVRLGGPIFLKSDDPAALAREHKRLGYAAAYCPAADVKNTPRVNAIEAAFKAENVVIAEVGAWKNLLDPDAAKRKENFDYVVSRMALAEAVGARCCVDIAGSFNDKVWYGPHKDNFTPRFFDATVENARKIIDAVKPRRAKFAFEIMGWCMPETADRYVQLIKAIDRPAFAAHVDVCNAINSPEKFYSNAAVTDEIFRKLGKWIVSCHAKDLQWIPEMNVHFVEVIPGRGEIDYRPYLRGIAGLGYEAPLMLEHLKTAEEYNEGAAYIRKIGAQAGVSFA
ncbi:MAG: sugar phosphate isomerase/epimerase [Acidobacteria bacterium]|nr:sugar phosphate isomerase/epimerase [Acidobacteriota bacterium]